MLSALSMCGSVPSWLDFCFAGRELKTLVSVLKPASGIGVSENPASRCACIDRLFKWICLHCSIPTALPSMWVVGLVGAGSLVILVPSPGKCALGLI